VAESEDESAGDGEGGTADVGQVPGRLPGLSSRADKEAYGRPGTDWSDDDDDETTITASNELPPGRPASQSVADDDARWLPGPARPGDVSGRLVCVRVCEVTKRHSRPCCRSSLIKTSHVV